MKIPQNVTPSDHSFTISKLQQTAQAKASVSKSSAPSVGQYDSAKMNDLAEEFSGKNSEHASPDMRRICSLFTNNQSFRTFLEENTKFSICEKSPEGDRQVAPPGVSRENILREMLKGGEELTPTELNDFEKLLRNELTEHPEKWAAELATFADVDPAALSPKEEKYIEDMLAVLDEYNHIKDKNGDGSNATHYTPFAVDTDWLKLKDKTLLSSEAPRPEGVKEDDVLRVSPDAMMQVRDAQMAIGYLKQHVDSEYSGKLERNIADGGANHIEVCIQTMGQALAESVTALCKTTVHEDTSPDSALYWQQENAIVEILARDTVELLGEEGAMALLGDNTRSDFDKMRAEIFRLPDEQKVVRQKEMQKKLQEALTTHLTAVAKKDAGLSKDLGALTKKAMDKNSKAKLASLKVSAASIQHAINKSRHLREKIEKWGNTETKEKYAALLTAMKNCEKTLDKTLTKLNRFAPGVTDNLKTAGIGLLYKAWDGSLANHYNKKWQGIKNGLSSVGNKINNVRKEADGFLFSKMNISRSLPENKKTELSTLLIPLEDSADQLRTVAQPLQTAAEKLERVLRHHDKDFDAKIHNRVKINAKKEAQKNADNAGMILATMLNVALEKNGSLTRLENKKQEREEKVNILRDNTLKVLSHVKDKLEDELEKNITTLSDTFSNSGVAREYIELARKLAKNMTEQLESMEITLVAAELADENKMGSIAGEIAKTAKKVVEQADQLSADIKLITGKVLGIQFGYGPYEKNMVRYLVSEASKLSNEGKSDTGLMTGWLESETSIKPEIIGHLQSCLSDPTRGGLRRKNDPTNAVLRAGLKQELDNLHRRTQPSFPTVQQIVAQTTNVTEMALKKATQKAISSLASLGVSGLTGADVVADISNSVMNALDPSRRLLHPKQTLRAMQVYQGFNGVKGVREATMPGQRRQDYAAQKVLGREAANIGMTVVTSLVPPVMALPVTGALALYAAATRPEKFIENVASELPVSIAVSGLYAGFRGGSSLYERASVERVKSLLRNADSNVNKLQRIDFTSGIGLQALAEHIQEEQDDFERKAYKGRGDKVEQDVGKIADIVSRGRSEMTQVQNEEIDRALSTALKQLEQEKKKLEGSLTQKESELIKSMGKTQKGLLTECNAQIKRLRSYQKGGDNENQLVILGRQKTGAPGFAACVMKGDPRIFIREGTNDLTRVLRHEVVHLEGKEEKETRGTMALLKSLRTGKAIEWDENKHATVVNPLPGFHFLAQETESVDTEISLSLYVDYIGNKLKSILTLAKNFSDIQQWAKDSLTKKIRAAGFKGVIDWSSTVTVYKKGLGNSGPTALLAHGSSVTDDQTQKSYTLLQYAYREWAREIGGDDPDDYYAKADDISDVPIVDVLNTTNLQVEYINEVKAFYSKPEVESLMAKMKHTQLEKAVTDYVRHHSTVNNDVLKKIKNGDVELVELNGKRLNNLVSIDLANGNKLFVSLTDSKVYEATVTDSGRSLKFATKEIADQFSLTLKGSSTLRALKDADSNFGRTMDDGTLQLVDPNKENKFLGNYTPVFVRGVLAHDGTGSIFKTISTGNNYNRNYSVELTKEHANTLVSDADYMMKSTGEISLDYWMNTVGKWGTRAGVLCLPVFGVLGVGASSGSALAFLGSASASWVLTMVTGVGTETVMAFAADREADASAHLKNAWVAMRSELVGQGLGEFVIPKVMQLTPRFLEIVENALKRTSRIFKNVDEVADFIKKLDSDNFSSGYDSVNLDSKSSSSFNTKSKSLSSNSSSSGYDSPHDSRSVKTKRKFNEDALKNATKNMEDLTDSYKKFMSVGSEPKYKLYNELQYRALWLKLEQEGYNVKTGFVTILNDSGYKSRALILKASKHGEEDAFMYIKPPHTGQASIHGTEFDNNLKIFNEEDFSKHYLSDFEHNSNLVTVDWYDGYFSAQQRGFYGENHVFGSDAQVLNRPKWFDSQKAEAAVDLLAIRRRGGATPEELQIATSRFAKYVKDVPDYALAIGALPAGYTAVDLVPKLVNSLESASFEEVTAPDGQKAADAPSNIAYVGTDLTLIKPSRSSDKSGISVLSLNNEPITVHRNNDIKGAVQQATQTHEKLNFAEETKPSKKNFALQSQVLAVKNKFGSNINPDAIKTPIVIAIDTSKIPGYKAGQPLPVFIPFEAIIEIKTDKGYADTTNYFADTFLSRDVSVSEIKVNPIERFEHTIAADKTTIQHIALFYSTKFNETYENILAHILRDNREAINSSNRAVVNGEDSLSIGTKLKIRKYPPKEPWAGTPDERTAWERQKIMQRANMQRFGA